MDSGEVPVLGSGVEVRLKMGEETKESKKKMEIYHLFSCNSTNPNLNPIKVK
jgi:hypothetical protein